MTSIPFDIQFSSTRERARGLQHWGSALDETAIAREDLEWNGRARFESSRDQASILASSSLFAIDREREHLEARVRGRSRQWPARAPSTFLARQRRRRLAIGCMHGGCFFVCNKLAMYCMVEWASGDLGGGDLLRWCWLRSAMLLECGTAWRGAGLFPRSP